MSERHIPESTVARLPRSLQVRVDAVDAGTPTLSSEDLAAAAGLTSAKVRKDLSFLGSHGTRGVGYEVHQLAAELSDALGLTVDRPVAIVGIGNLGRALASYGGFDRRGFRIAALIDVDPDKVGVTVGDHVVEPAADLARIIAERGIGIAVLATPVAASQPMADAAVAAGATAILNFAPTHLTVPDHVTVRTVDLSTELQILSFYERGLTELRAAAG